MEYEERFKPIYNIKKAEELSGVPANLIRVYEKIGLIKPYREPGNNYRYFTFDEIEWISRIKILLNDVGLNSEGIKCLLTLEKCWEEHECPRGDRECCAVFREKNTPCWMVKEEIKCCPLEECYKCERYISARKHYKLEVE